MGSRGTPGESLVTKGWGDVETYGKIFLPEFQQAAQERRRGRLAEEEQSMLFF